MCAELKNNLLKVEPTAVCMLYVTGTGRYNCIGMDLKLHYKSCLYIWHSKDALTCMSLLKQNYRPTKLPLNLILSNKLHNLLCSRVHGQHHKVTHFHTNYLLHNTLYNVKVLLRAMWNSFTFFVFGLVSKLHQFTSHIHFTSIFLAPYA